MNGDTCFLFVVRNDTPHEMRLCIVQHTHQILQLLLKTQALNKLHRAKTTATFKEEYSRIRTKLLNSFSVYKRLV